MTAVLLVGYNRPENLLQRITELSRNRPEKLYISIDGSDNSVIRTGISESIETGAKLYFDPKTLNVNIMPRNLGLSSHIDTAVSKILETEENVLVLEDDIRITETLVSQLSSGFREFSKSPNFGTIGGFSGVPIYSEAKRNYWRQTPAFSAWGWMIGRHSWSKYSLQIPKGDLEEQLKKSKSWHSLSKTQKNTWLHRFGKVQANPSLTWDYQMQFMCFKYDHFNVLPLFRICENVGFADSRSTNTKNAKPVWMQDHVLFQGEFNKSLSPFPSKILSKHVDSFTISGDSYMRKRINILRQR